MLLLILMSLAIVKADVNTASDHCDLIEHNSYHDASGRLVLDQLIFWEWSPSLDRYHVREWTLSDNDKQPQRDYRSGLWITKYTDRDAKLDRVIKSAHYRRSFTQVDPERENQKLLPESERHGLIKRLPPQPA